jgi:hypothetical protein
MAKKKEKKAEFALSNNHSLTVHFVDICGIDDYI